MFIVRKSTHEQNWRHKHAVIVYNRMNFETPIRVGFASKIAGLQISTRGA